MVWILVGVAVALVPLFIVLLNAQKKYKALFADANLIAFTSAFAELVASDGADSRRLETGLVLRWDPEQFALELNVLDKLNPAAAGFLLCLAVESTQRSADAPATFLKSRRRYTVVLPVSYETDRKLVVSPVTEETIGRQRMAAADAMRIVTWQPHPSGG